MAISSQACLAQGGCGDAVDVTYVGCSNAGCSESVAIQRPYGSPTYGFTNTTVTCCGIAYFQTEYQNGSYCSYASLGAGGIERLRDLT